MGFEVGQTYRAILGGSNLKIHIVGIIEGMIVYRWYGKHKQWWHYEVDHPDMVQLHIDLVEKYKK